MKLALVGVGLIGGSFALAMRRRFDTSPEALRRATELGVIDEMTESAAGAVHDATW